MPESPDFDQIARELSLGLAVLGVAAYREAFAKDLAEQLRQVWNARGAADLAKVDAEMAASAGHPHAKNLDRALRSLDR